MNHYHYHHQPQAQSQAYHPSQFQPQLGFKLAPQLEPQSERQACGFTLCIIFAIIFILSGIVGFVTAILNLDDIFHFIVFAICGIGLWTVAAFFIISLAKPSYLGGKPAFSKILPFSIGLFLGLYSVLSISCDDFLIGLSAILPTAFYSAVAYCMYLGDDDSGSCCLCFKPWVIKTPAPIMYAPQYGYPTHGYPQQPQAQAQTQYQAYHQQQQQQFQNSPLSNNQQAYPQQQQSQYQSQKDSSSSIAQQTPPPSYSS